MSFRFTSQETAGAGLRRLLGEQIDRAVAELRDKRLSRGRAVHQLRRRCKRIRALLRLARGPLKDRFRRENHFYRDLARPFSAARDAEVLGVTFRALGRRHQDRMDPAAARWVRGEITRARSAAAEDGRRNRRLFPETIAKLRAGRTRLKDLPLNGEGFDPLAKGLKKTYRAGRHALVRARQSRAGEDFHEWRKRVKDLRYQIEALRPLKPAEFLKMEKDLHRLTDMLGEEHDLAVFAAWLADTVPAAVTGDRAAAGLKRALRRIFTAARLERRACQRSALVLGRRIYRPKSRDVVHRVGRSWNHWQAGVKEHGG